MKKIASFCLAFFTLGIFAFSQTIVVTEPQAKNVVLEEFTGINCGYCPDGHARSQALSDSHPGRVVLVNVHQGNYAVPSGGQPDFRTAFGDALATQAGVSGYPAGTVNRRLYPGLTTGTYTTLNRGAWTTAADFVFPEQSPVNIGFTSQFDSISRLLTVMVELYYTKNSATPTNYINIALLESGVIAFQADYNAGNHANYNHKHMLRHLITGQWGDTTNSTTMGSFFTRTYTYTVPPGFNMDSCDVAVYVAESHKDILTGGVAPAKGGTSTGATAMYIGSIDPPSAIIDNGVPVDTNKFVLVANSSFPATQDFTFTLTNDAPGDWNSEFDINGTIYNTTATIPLTLGTPINIEINVIPGATPGFAVYTLTMESVLNPSAPAIIQKVYVNSGITDLIVKSDGAWGDGNAYNFDTVYTSGLNYANNTSFGSTTAGIMKKGFDAIALESVKHIYFNAGWMFPTMTDEVATALKQFMNAGGNLFIAGQDVGWDIMSGSGYGTTTTQDLYSNYLHASYTADGTPTNNQLNAVAADTVFGTVPVSSIVDVYAGNMYPDQVNIAGIGKKIFYYNGNPAKNCGVRATNGVFKTVYLGVSPEMISNTTVRKQVIKLAHDWFHGLIASVDYDEAMLNLSLGQNYPNPCNTTTTIPVNNLNNNMSFQILDLTGRIVYEQSVSKDSNLINLNTTTIESGMYLYRLVDGTKTIATKPMQIIR